MTLWNLAWSSFKYHFRSHLGTIAGVAVASAVLAGALTVGDSVRGSLRKFALDRLGKIETAVETHDRFFRDRLARELSTNGQAAAILKTVGSATKPDASSRANNVQVLGIREDFWSFATEQALSNLPPGQVILNERLATQLKAKIGESIILRVDKPSLLSREAPVSGQNDAIIALRVQVHGTVSDQHLGRFSLNPSQTPPFNAFVDRGYLQQQLQQQGKANLLVGAGVSQESLNQIWKLEDSEAELRYLTNLGMAELRTRRVFLDDPLVKAAQQAAATNKVLTYFVNEFRAGDKSTPYSMVSAISGPGFPIQVKPGEMVINDWLASDLNAKTGDTISVRYFVLGTEKRLEERTNQFRVASIVPLEGFAADRELMPEFPGLAKAESSDDWDTGFPVDLSKIRDKDETYWKERRGTPKAFISLEDGQRMWANRFGDLTAIRWPMAQDELPMLAATLRQKITPQQFGLTLAPVRQQALAAANEAQDFGQLFIGFSFFLIGAALLLVTLLFVFALERRTNEAGLFSALGFQSKLIKRALLIEGTVLAIIGTLIGLPFGVLYAKGLLWGLQTIWKDAIGAAHLQLFIVPLSLIIAFAATVLCSLGVMWLGTRSLTKRTAHQLLSGTGDSSAELRAWRIPWDVAFLVVGAALLGYSFVKRADVPPYMFFMAGAILVTGAIFLAGRLLRRTNLAGGEFTEKRFALSQGVRRYRRSLASVSLLALGSFLVVAIQANRLDADANSNDRASGTGGFALIGEAALPLVQRLDEQTGRDFYGLPALQGVDFVSMRVKEGDDASCLNLNRAQEPRLLAVRPSELSDRKAFTFAAELEKGSGWNALNKFTDDEVPAIGDAASVKYAMGKKPGDTFTYTDESGRQFKVKIVATLQNSILQGNLIIPEAAFLRRYPSASGYRMFLIDAPSNQKDAVAATLARSLQDAGFEVTTAVQRLNEFNAVQNTYLGTFQVLGGLGLLLGTAGLGIILLRNVLERKAELAVMMAIGFTKRRLKKHLFGEHGFLLFLGVAAGTFAGLAAILPTQTSRLEATGLIGISIFVAMLLLLGLLSTWAGSAAAVRGDVLNTLRNN